MYYFSHVCDIFIRNILNIFISNIFNVRQGWSKDTRNARTKWSLYKGMNDKISMHL